MIAPVTPGVRDLNQVFGGRLKTGEPLARYTSARIGGPADYLAVAESAAELADLLQTAWQAGETPLVLGGGSNVLVSDLGVCGLVIVNRARGVAFRDGPEAGDRPTVRAESGVSFGQLARQCAARGLGGLAWAGTVPGTLGGAVVGNAGAHGGDLAGNLVLAEILQQEAGARAWPAAELEFGYRTSRLKRQRGAGRQWVVLSAELALSRAKPEAVQAQIDEFVSHRKRTQPPGASIGSMFKNPPGDYAGRLIEAAGLKGARRGQAEISPLHANFFVNHGEARAADVLALLQLAQRRVLQESGITLELEVELVGEWPNE